MGKPLRGSPRAFSHPPAGDHFCTAKVPHQKRRDTRTCVSSFLLCVDKKDATFPVVRKERDVCRGNLSRVNTVAALRFAAIQTPQIAPLPRNGFASSAAGGASPVSPCFLIPPQDKFAKQTCPLQKRNTTQWVVFLFCLVLTEKMRSGKCTTVQSVESSIMTTKPLTKSTSCCGSRSCGLYKIRPQRKGRQTCRFFLCDLKIMNLLQNQRGRCIDSGSQLLIEHIQTLGVSAE